MVRMCHEAWHGKYSGTAWNAACETKCPGMENKSLKVWDIEKLKTLLIYAINNKTKMKEMGSNGRDYVEENFSEEKILLEWEKFYLKNV